MYAIGSRVSGIISKFWSTGQLWTVKGWMRQAVDVSEWYGPNINVAIEGFTVETFWNSRDRQRQFLSCSSNPSLRIIGDLENEHRSCCPQELGAAPVGSAECMRAAVCLRSFWFFRTVDWRTADQLGGTGRLRSCEWHSERRRYILRVGSCVQYWQYKGYCIPNK